MEKFQKTNPNDVIDQIGNGLTKREYFTTIAFKALIERGNYNPSSTAVELADKLIEELNKK